MKALTIINKTKVKIEMDFNFIRKHIFLHKAQKQPTTRKVEYNFLNYKQHQNHLEIVYTILYPVKKETLYESQTDTEISILHNTFMAHKP